MQQTRRIIRLGALAVIGAALVAAGCSGTDSTLSAGFREGQVQVVFSAASLTTGLESTATLEHDGPSLQAAEVTLSSILARNLDGELIAMTIDLPATVDLIGLVQGQTVELPMGSLPVGMYDQIVVVIRTVSLTLLDGTKIDVTPPGGGWTAIVPTVPFEVAEGLTTTVQLRFRPGGALRWIDDHFEFHPEFDCDVDDGGDHDGDHDGEDDD